jgi:hypothetical protein
MYKISGLRKEYDYVDGVKTDYIVKIVFATVADRDEANQLMTRHYQNIKSHALNFQVVTLEEDGRLLQAL